MRSDWSQAWPDFLVTFAGVFIALALEGLLGSRRGRARERVMLDLVAEALQGVSSALSDLSLWLERPDTVRHPQLPLAGLEGAASGLGKLSADASALAMLGELQSQLRTLQAHIDRAFPPDVDEWTPPAEGAKALLLRECGTSREVAEAALMKVLDRREAISTIGERIRSRIERRRVESQVARSERAVATHRARRLKQGDE